MSLNLKLLKKIHHDAGEKSHIAVTKDWKREDDLYELEDNTFYDKLFKMQDFISTCEELIDEAHEDVYFSINSFSRKEKLTCRAWHLNAFVLDFDYYKIDKYKGLSAQEMYEKYIKSKLPLEPTAVVDSGRGLYVIYTFKHSCKKVITLYQSIYKSFLKNFEKYGLDANAMNVTQIIRVPGTLNSKCLREVEVLQLNETSYRLADFFALLPYTLSEVKDYKKSKQKKLKIEQHKELTEEQKLQKSKFKDEQTELIIKDLKKLIHLRNQRGKDSGYRELLIYIVRRRMIWKEGSVEEELEIAHQMNKLFNDPLSDKEVNIQCKPCGRHKCFKISTIIQRLEISPEEQAHMKILRKKSMKDSHRLKRKRLIKLLNLTEKQRVILERRTKVAKLKNEGKKNAQIAMLLTVDKSTVTRDLHYINKYSWKFIKKLKDAMEELSSYIDTNYFTRLTRYEEQQSLLEWLKISEILLN